MAIVVNTNLSALTVQRNLFNTTNALSKSMRNLSTGVRINSAGDDAAGLSLSTKLNSAISASDVAKSNSQTAINMLQTAESDLAVISDNLQRMRDLAVQSANGVYSSSERAAINAEFMDRMEEIDRVAQSSRFSDLFLLNGSMGTVEIQIGTDSTAQSRIDISSAFQGVSTTALGVTTGTAVSDSTISTATDARTALDTLDSALNTISEKRSEYGATINRLTASVSRTDIRKENLAASNSVIKDTDIAAETANLTKQQILQQTATTLLKQANQSGSLAISLLQ
ncbi:MAG: flagellin [Candidatus Gastranaerophilales bacterium]|nr:flagellin [Candidatus Gastranaerophilales bacterium]